MKIPYWATVRQEYLLLGGVLRERTFFLILLLPLLLYSLVLQWPSAGKIDVGAGLEPPRMNSFDHLVGSTRDERVGRPLDQAFLKGFYAEESGANYSFRWSEPEAHINIAGLARSPLLLRLRLHGAPAGSTTITQLEADGQPLAEFAVPYPLHEYAFVVDPALWSGDTLSIGLHSSPLRPGGEDTRVLGVAMDRLAWAGWRTGWQLSLPQSGLFLAGAAIFVYLGLRRAGLRERGAGTGALLWSLVPLAGLLVPTTRPFVALYGPGLCFAAAISYPTLVLTLHAAEALLRQTKHPPNQRDWRWLAVLFLLSFLLRFGGAMSPRYASHDAGFHAHRIEFIERGDLFFEHVSLEAGLRSDPYPGTLYLLLAPAASFLQDREGLLAFSLAWLGSSEILLIWFLARRLANSRTSRWATLLYLSFPIGLAAYWFGIYANLFAIWLSLLAIVSILLVLEGRVSPSPLLWVPLFALVFLAHFGNTVLWSILCPLWGLLLYRQGGALQRVRLRRLATAWLLALALSVAVYYGHFLPFFLSMFQVPGTLLPEALAPAAETGPGMLSRTLAELRVWWRWGVVADYAALGLPLGGLGLLLPSRQRSRPVVLLLSASVAAALLFWAMSMVTFFFVRYMLFLLPAAALGTARVLSLCWKKGPAGRVFALALLLYIGGMTLWMWIALCVLGLAPVHVL